VQPGWRDRLEIPGIGEERERLPDLDRRDLRAFEEVIARWSQGAGTLSITWLTPFKAGSARTMDGPRYPRRRSDVKYLFILCRVMG